MPISKKILEITGIEVTAMPIKKTKPKDKLFPFSPIKLSLK